LKPENLILDEEGNIKINGMQKSHNSTTGELKEWGKEWGKEWE
jgi:hypothetical protein